MLAHSVTEQIFTKPLTGARQSFRGWGYSNEQDSPNPCSHRAHSHMELKSLPAPNGGIKQEKRLWVPKGGARKETLQELQLAREPLDRDKVMPGSVTLLRLLPDLAEQSAVLELARPASCSSSQARVQ